MAAADAVKKVQDGWPVRALTSDEIVEALLLFDREIEIFDLDSANAEVPTMDAVKNWMTETMRTPAPPPTWLGAFDEGILIGAVYASPHYDQAWPQVLRGSPYHLIQKYVQIVSIINNVAVEPSYRRRGIARALLAEALRELKSLQVRHVVAYASDSAARAPVQGAGVHRGSTPTTRAGHGSRWHAHVLLGRTAEWALRLETPRPRTLQVAAFCAALFQGMTISGHNVASTVPPSKTS